MMTTSNFNWCQCLKLALNGDTATPLRELLNLANHRKGGEECLIIGAILCIRGLPAMAALSFTKARELAPRFVESLTEPTADAETAELQGLLGRAFVQGLLASEEKGGDKTLDFARAALFGDNGESVRH